MHNEASMIKRLAAAALLLIHFQTPAFCQIKGSLWDIPAIYEPPAYETISSDTAIGIIYKGLYYRGGPQRVFAYYATPGTVSGDRSLDHNLPAVVLVHGGGGTAFKEWVTLWAKKGYAAIAMDLRGNGPDKQHIEHGFIEPDNKTPYFTITAAIEDQWMYQAVANVILAHNLLRNMPGVDSTRTAITGISWGGIITSLMTGLDTRYKAAVPVYVCGHLHENSAMKKELDLLRPVDRATWVKQYDPSNYVNKASMPVLFINGTNDGHFYLDSYAKTYQEVKDRNLSIKVGLKHNHRYGWSNDEIYAFIGSFLKDGSALAKVYKVNINKDKVRATVQTVTPLKKAQLCYTTDTAALLKDKVWQTLDVELEGKTIRSKLPPAGTFMWFLTVTDERGLISSGAIQFGRRGELTP